MSGGPRAFLAFAAAYLLLMAHRTGYDEHVRQAWAILHGHAYIATPVWEEAIRHGHAYILHPPLASWLMLPIVALWGQRTNQTVIGAIAGAAGCAACWRFCAGITAGETFYTRVQNSLVPAGGAAAAWLTAFLGFGTVFGYEATLGASWGLCLVLSVPFTFLALDEAINRRRPLRAGIYAGLAALSRYDLVMAWPVYWMLAGRERQHPHPDPLPQRSGRGDLLWGFGAAAALYVAWAWVRFDGPIDISLWLWYLQDPIRATTGRWGAFSPHYLPLGLYTALFMAPGFQPTFPWLRPQMFGQALIFTSPALLLALRAGPRTKVRATGAPVTVWLWAAVGLTMAGALCVYSNGVEQFGARYWIQALPFLIALMAMGWRDDVTSRVLIALSILLTVSGSATVRVLGWP